MNKRSRVARWFVFKPKIPIWVNFGGACYGKSILRPSEIFYGHLVYFVVIWYIFPRFGILDQEKSGNPEKESILDFDLKNVGVCFATHFYTISCLPTV
jgi:hypothetical protein